MFIQNESLLPLERAVIYLFISIQNPFPPKTRFYVYINIILISPPIERGVIYLFIFIQKEFLSPP